MLTLPTQEELAALKKIAATATPGPWAWGQTLVSTPADALEICRQNIDATISPTELFCEVFLEDGRRTALIGNGPTSAANAAFIAVFNPHAILALLALIDAQNKRIAELLEANQG